MDLSQVKGLLDKLTGDAQGIISDTSGVEKILRQLENKLKEVPVIGDTLSNLPTMISMVKAWITKEYTVVSPKVIACLVGATLYFLKKDDLINDRIPVVGLADDVAVMGLALKLSEPELEAFKAWKESKNAVPAPAAANP